MRPRSPPFLDRDFFDRLGLAVLTETTGVALVAIFVRELSSTVLPGSGAGGSSGGLSPKQSEFLAQRERQIYNKAKNTYEPDREN